MVILLYFMCAMFIFQHNKMHKHWGISKLFLKRRHYLINSTLLKCHTVVRENNEPNSTSQSMMLIVTIQHNDGLRAVVFFIKGSILPDLLCKICFSGPFLICCEWLMVYKQCLMIHFPCLFFTSLKKNINTLRHWMNTLNEIMDGPAFHCFAAETESIK